MIAPAAVCAVDVVRAVRRAAVDPPGLRRDVVDAMVARAKRMSARGCGSVRSLAEGQVVWHLSDRAITAVEAAAVLRETDYRYG